MPPFTNLTLSWPSEEAFLSYWEPHYIWPDAELYDPHIGKRLTEKRLWDLFHWKNGGPIAARKRESIRRNYPVRPPKDLAGRYLNPRQAGGAIWNIFYLHCVDPQRWPIYDQHAHRAMIWILDGVIDELPTAGTHAAKSAIYTSYQQRFIPFITEHFTCSDFRRIDRSLFAFGKVLKSLAAHLPR